MAADQNFDVVIAGGGLVGGSLALALAETDASIALVEAVPPDHAEQPSFDDRTIALARGSCRILERLGVWSLIGDSIWPIEQIHISQQSRFGTAVIDAREQGISALGHVINSRVLGTAIWSCIEQRSNIDVFCPGKVSATRIDGDYRIAEVNAGDDSQTLRGRLLVVADGARSQLRTALGIAAQERDYEQVAVVARIQVDGRRAGRVAYERFTDEGPLAILPGADGEYTLVLARKKDTVAALMEMPDTDLLELVQSLFGYRLGRLQRIGARQAYPLYLVTADDIVAERAVVIGNAANGLHPVAAQGFNLGLRDVASLAELIADALREENDADAGDAGLIEAYADWREEDQRSVVEFTDGLIRLFGVPGDAAAALRGLSLAAFDVMPGAKQELARRTMGLAGRMSRLARGLPL
jgi:2-octaprenyl-6-methoxyphenol hydroxylase